MNVFGYLLGQRVEVKPGKKAPKPPKPPKRRTVYSPRKNKPTSIVLTPGQRAKLKLLGGSKWLRQQIDAAEAA